MALQVARPWQKAWPKRVSVSADQGPPEPRPLFELVSDTAKRYPGRVCLRFQGSSMTYGMVEDVSSRFATALTSLGLRRGERVALLLPNMPQFVMAYFGTLKAGGVVVPCSPLFKQKELRSQLKDSGSRFLVAVNDVVEGEDLFASVDASMRDLDIKVITASLTDYLPGVKRPLARFAGVRNARREGTQGSFTELVARSPPLAYKTFEVDPRRDLAVLQYTGGTTGVSKGAMLTHANLYTNAEVIANWLPLGDRDVSLAVLPLFHIYGMTTAMNAPLYAGGSIVLLPRFEVGPVMKTIQREKVTSFCGVPTMYMAVLHHPDVSKFSLKTIRACISGGAALPVAISKAMRQVSGGVLVEGYGLSEASPVTHCNPIGEGAVVKEGSIGVPLPFTDARIVDMEDRSRELGVGEVGELAVSGPQVMLGYWNTSAETDGVLRDGWLLTGDIAKMDEDGYFYIVDRKKDMIDVAGLKVYPREVEEVLFTKPEVREAGVVGMPDEYRGEAVHAYVVLRPESKGKFTEEEIIDFCRANLASYKAPRKVTFVDELPKTLVGKVLRMKLKAQEEEAERGAKGGKEG